MPEKCYLCNKVFNDSTTLKHGEHVIQNSIGGALISESILCAKCGSKLGNSVDESFRDALAPITVLLRPPRDRGSPAKAEAKIKVNTASAIHLESLHFLLKEDFSVVPTKPFFMKDEEKNTLTVVATTLQKAEAFSKAKNVQSELAKAYKLEFSDNASVYLRDLLVPVNPNSNRVLRGVLKIAIGYASHNEIRRELFAHLITSDNEDLTDSEALLRSTVFSYFPTNDAERLFETEKFTHENHYPTHHLYLFSQGTNLYCYVELFGTLQKYVHLTKAYNGPKLLRKFVQKAEKYEYDESTFIAKDFKDLDILAQEQDVTQDGKTWEEIQSEILNNVRKRAYSLNPYETIEKVQQIVHLLAEFSILKNGENFEVVRSMFEKANKAKSQLGLALLDNLKSNPLLIKGIVTKTFDDFRMGDLHASCPDISRLVPAEELEKYVSYKFYELLRAKGREEMMQFHIIE